MTPLGATKEKQVEVRVVAASNVDFPRKIAAGEFRQDLYFRLARYTVAAPPLRERREDIPLLAEHFAKLFATEMGRQPPEISTEAIAALMTHSFTGNVRELKNLIEGALIESGGAAIRPEHLRFAVSGIPATPIPASTIPTDLPLNLEQAERALMQRALAQAGGNVSKAAEMLGVNRARIYRTLAQTEPDDGV